MLKRVRITTLDLYWRLCQYPWHTIINILLAVTCYGLTIVFSRVWESTLYHQLTWFPGSTIVSFIIIWTIPYLVFSLLIVNISIPILLNEGIIFNVMGYTFFYWFALFPLHLVGLVIINEPWVQGIKIFVCIITIGLLGFFILSFVLFPNCFRKKRIAIATSVLDYNFRIVHLSDIHAERFGWKEKTLIKLVNNEKPDLIIITGDMFVRPYEYNITGFKAAVEVCKQLRARYGIYIVSGHHDHKQSCQIVRKTHGKVYLLNDEWARLNDHGVKISLFGASLNSTAAYANHKLHKDNFSIYFAHDPRRILNLANTNFSLALFGHTHAGQVYIPGLSQLIVGKYRYGRYTYRGIPVYVNAGIGCEGFLAPRIRWFTFPEVVIFDLAPGQR